MRFTCALGAAFAFVVVFEAASASAEEPAAPPPEAVQARTEIDGTLAGMRTRARQVRDLLRDARRRGTSRQVACVDEALSRTDVAVRRASEHGDASIAAYAQGDLDAARVARRHVLEQQLAQMTAARDASACAPLRTTARVVASTTTVEMHVDPGVPRGGN